MSKLAKKGYFSRLGNVHMHIDGAGHEDIVDDILDKTRQRNLLTKKIAIEKAINGPQINKSKQHHDTYEAHNPIGLDKDDATFDYFATIDLSGDINLNSESPEDIAQVRSLTVNLLKEILPDLQGCGDVRVEVEQVVGKLDYLGEWSEMPKEKAMNNITAVEVDLAPFDRTLPYEIHHGFDIQKNGVPPIPLAQLIDDCTVKGVEIGGWFFFKDRDRWLYRCNLFTNDDVFDMAKRQDVILRQYLDYELIENKKLTYNFKTVVERVLGIWVF